MTLINPDALRGGLRIALQAATLLLPREVREGFISQGALAILEAETETQAELELTAILAEIEQWLKDNVKP
jgi:hypothetical protein